MIEVIDVDDMHEVKCGRAW